MFKDQKVHYNEARAALQEFLDGKWWSDYLALAEHTKAMPCSLAFSLGHLGGCPATLHVCSNGGSPAYAYIERRGDLLTVAEVFRMLFGTNGQPLRPSPRELVQHLFLDVEARVDCLWQHAEKHGLTDHAKKCIKFENDYFMLFNSQIGHIQRLARWYAGATVKSVFLKLALKKW